MQKKVHHRLLIATLVSFVPIGSACGSDGPAIESGGEDESGETGEDIYNGCIPTDQELEVGGIYTCQGEGNGWLTVDVYGAGDANPVTGCLAYGGLTIPANPTPDDCAAIPLSAIPFDIPEPAACCADEALAKDIEGTCELDCGYAACKTAIAAIRETADELVPPNGIPKSVVERTQADLHAFADLLEAPDGLKYCAEKVHAHIGEIVPIELGEGPSDSGLFGHVNSATINLGCSLDPDEPFVFDQDADYCYEGTNIPTPVEEQEGQGLINAGSIQAMGPGVDTIAAMIGASFETREVLNADGSVVFTLQAFDATFEDTAAGSFLLSDPAVSLIRPASGTVEGELVTFGPGTLHFAVTASIAVDGSPLADGRPQTAQYANSSATTAVRGIDGSFAFIDALVVVGEYEIVLNTQIADIVEIQ